MTRFGGGPVPGLHLHIPAIKASPAFELRDVSTSRQGSARAAAAAYNDREGP